MFLLTKTSNSDIIWGWSEIEQFINWTANSFWAGNIVLLCSPNPVSGIFSFSWITEYKVHFWGFGLVYKYMTRSFVLWLDLAKALEKWIRYSSNLWNPNVGKYSKQYNKIFMFSKNFLVLYQCLSSEVDKAVISTSILLVKIHPKAIKWLP